MSRISANPGDLAVRVISSSRHGRFHRYKFPRTATMLYHVVWLEIVRL